MSLNPQTWRCPRCGSVLPDESIRQDRPFGCPNCHGVIEAVPWSFGLGCLTVSAVVALLLAVAGLSAKWAAVCGLAVGFAITLKLANTVRRHLPPRRKLRKHVLRFHPEVAGPLADWLENLAECSLWEEKQEAKLTWFDNSYSYDDGLETAAHFVARRYRLVLKGEAHGNSTEVDTESLRLELHSIARDIRRSLTSD